MSVTLATEADFPAIRALLFDHFFKEHAFPGNKPPLNEEKAEQYIRHHMANGPVLLWNGGEGALSLIRQTLWWSDAEYLSDGFFYVKPEARKSRAAVELLKAAKRVGRLNGLPVVVGVWNEQENERKARFLSRMGFKPIGGWFMDGGF